MAKEKTPEQLTRQAEKARQKAERKRRSAEAMAAGPDVYAKRIIASCLQVPFIHFWYSLFYIGFDYIFGGHFIVKTWQKLLIKAGYISEGALGVAGLWALANHTLHSYLAQNTVTSSLIDPLNAFTMAAFTLIPDLILASAILVTINRFKSWSKKEEKAAWLWAFAYIVPTIIFACLTCYTLSTVSTLAGGGDMSQVVYASGTELQIRVLSAYFYGLIEILYAFTHKGAGHGMVSPLQPLTPPQPVPAPQVNIQELIDQAVNAATNAVATVATEQKGMIEDLSKRLETATNLQRVQQQTLLAQVQQKPVASVDPNVVADIVMQRLDKKIQALLQQHTMVAEATGATNPQMNAIPAAPRATALLNAPQQPAPKEHQGQESTPPTNISSFQQRNKTATGKTAQIFDLLNKDRNLEPVELARLAECDRTLAWKVRKSWMKANNIVSDVPEKEEKAGSDGNGENGGNDSGNDNSTAGQAEEGELQEGVS